MDERRLEIKVGALVLVAVAGVLGAAVADGRAHARAASAVLAVDFSHTGNVVKGAPVKLGGVVVGRVEEIDLRAGPAGRAGRAAAGADGALGEARGAGGAARRTRG